MRWRIKQKGLQMIPKVINGQWRVVDMQDRIVTAKVFDSWDDAASYCDKFEDVRGMI